MISIKSIAILTSGGDAPGMNACIRAVVRSSIQHHIQVFGVFNGFDGLIDDNIKKLNSKNVGNIIQRGGTILKSSRSKRFITIEGRAAAFNNLKKNEIDALIVIGGDGTFKGASQFSNMI